MENLAYSLLYVLIAGSLVWASGAIGSLFSEYEKVSAVIIRETFSAFNLIYRILFPVISTFIIANISFLCGVELNNSWLIVLFYCIIRILFIFFMDRLYIANMRYIIICSLISVALAITVYSITQDDNTYFFPSRENIISQFWLFIFLFVYKIIDNTYRHGKFYHGREKKLKKYVDKKTQEFFSLYKKQILSVTKDINVINIILSIMIVENYNRPKFIRYIERFFSSYSKTKGIMQVRFNGTLSDEGSVTKGAMIIQEHYNKAIEKYKDDYEIHIIDDISKEYNPSDLYVEMVKEIFRYVNAQNVMDNKKLL